MSDIKPVKLRLEIHPLLKKYLERLVRTGLYGNNVEDAGWIVISRHVEEMLHSGHLERLENYATETRFMTYE